jgi:hypothetical protein
MSENEVEIYNKSVLANYAQKYGLKTAKPEAYVSRLLKIAYGDGKIDPERLENTNLIISAIDNPPANCRNPILKTSREDLMRFVIRFYCLKNNPNPDVIKFYTKKQKEYKSKFDISPDTISLEFEKLHLIVFENPTPELIQKYLVVSLYKYCKFFSGHYLHRMVWRDKDKESLNYIDLENKVIVMNIKNKYIIIPLGQKLYVILNNLHDIINSKYVLPDFNDNSRPKFIQTHKLFIASIFGTDISDKNDETIIKVSDYDNIPAIVRLINENMELKKVMISKLTPIEG